MWVSRPGLGLETDQRHFFEVLVLVLASLVLVSEGGLEQDGYVFVKCNKHM